MLLIAALAFMTVAIMVLAYPGQDHPTATMPEKTPESGTAAQGWLNG